MPEKVISSAAKPEDVQGRHGMAKAIVTNKIGIKVDDVKAIDLEKFRAQIKPGKSLEFVISCDGKKFSYFVRMKDSKEAKVIKSMLLAAITDAAARKKTLEALKGYDLITDKQIAELVK